MCESVRDAGQSRARERHRYQRGKCSFSCIGKSANIRPPPAVPGRTPRSKRDLDADLQRAIELSLQDSQPASREFVGSEPPLRTGTVEDDDEQLRLAIEASLRDMDQARPSAPIGMDEPEFKVSGLSSVYS